MSSDDWYRPEAHEVDLGALGRKAAGAAGALAKKGINVARREAMKAGLRRSFRNMASSENQQVLSLKRVLADINPESSMAKMVQELISLKQRETDLLTSIERQV